MAADTKVDVYLPLYVRDFLTSTIGWTAEERGHYLTCLLYTSPSPRDRTRSRMPSSA